MADSADVLAKVLELNREPFRELLAKMLDCAPTLEALQQFSADRPDRWAQAVAIMGKLSGFPDLKQSESAVNVDHSITLKIGQLSDAELEHELQSLLTNTLQTMTAEEIQALAQKAPIAGTAREIENE
jgi:hypothetical protein